MNRWVIGTGNRHKLLEIQQIVAPFGVALATPAELGLALEVVEDGDTFAANAALKALAWTRATGMPAIADDSGLEVDALGGEPGVWSARWAGRDGDDAANNAKLVSELGARAPDGSPARYRCVIAVAWPAADESVVAGSLPERAVREAGSDDAWRTERVVLRTFSGVMEGRVTVGARGEGGFGYDPHFVVEGGRHLAELTPEEKHPISHRGAALRKLARWLADPDATA